MDISLDEFIKAKREGSNSAKNVGTSKSISMGPRGAGKRHSAGSGIGNLAPQGPSGINTKSGINAKWTHDLHHRNNTLESRVTKHSKLNGPSIPPSVAAALSGNKLFAALHGDANLKAPAASNGVAAVDTGLNMRGMVHKSASGFSIKGTAGPFVVRAQNFAQGTTAEDVRTAMAPLGKILSCKLLSANPTVLVEIVFEVKEVADSCVNKYNNQYADGRLIHVYHHDGPPIGKIQHTYSSPASSTSSSPNRSINKNNAAREEADRQRRLANESGIIDGKYGVSPTPVLYSDAIINRKGRGFQR